MVQVTIRLILAMGSRCGSALGGMLLSLIVARLTGADGLGQFAVLIALLGTLSLLALHGTDILLMRAVAWSDRQGHPEAGLMLLKHGALPVLLASILLGVVGSGLLASGLLGPPFPGGTALTPLILVIQSVLALAAGYAKGRSRPWLAPAFEIGGISLFAALTLLFLSYGGVQLQPPGVMICFVLALAVSSLIAAVMIALDRARRTDVSASAPQLDELRSGRLDFTLIAVSTFLAQAGSFLLAAPFLSEADLGLLRAAERLVIIVSFSVLIVDPVFVPRVVKLSRSGNLAELNRTILLVMLVSAGIATPILFALLVWPEAALRLMGADFAAASGHLRTMALAHFVVAVLGPLSMVLNMSWRERMSMWVSLATLVLALIMIPTLSWLYGPGGFVAAYCGIMVIRLTLIGFLVFMTRPNESGSQDDNA